MRSKKKELLGAQNKTESSVRTSQRWKEIIIAFAAIATFICKDTVLTQNVEKQGFLNWSKHFTQVQLPHLYYECRAKTLEEIYSVSCQTAASNVCTVHFIRDRHTAVSVCRRAVFLRTMQGKCQPEPSGRLSSHGDCVRVIQYVPQRMMPHKTHIYFV